MLRNRSTLLDLSPRSLMAAPGHPLKYLHHRSFFDLGANYRNFSDWQLEKAKPLYRKNLLAHFGCVNAIEFSKNGKLLVSGGDDRRVLLWNIDKAIFSNAMQPNVMHAEHLSNVFGLDFSCSSDKIFSAGNDDKVIVHDAATCVPLDFFVHEQPVYGISADPVNESIFCSACDDGRILIFDIRDSRNGSSHLFRLDPFCVAKATSTFHSVAFHPVEPRLLVTSNSKDGVCSWDLRMPRRVLIKYGIQNSNHCCMSARFNRFGSQILVLRRRLPPILYSTDSPTHLYQFSHRGYYNSCTMKSCSFAGLNDQYVMSGSDNFDLHIWKIPIPGSDQWVSKADMVLRGHRSIVNQVRFNYTHNLIASSGVEKLIKLWSPFPLPDEQGGKTPATVINESERRIYTPDDYVSLLMQTEHGHGQFMSLTHEPVRKTTREDSRMLAFFDALVQRDINGLSDDDSNHFPETSYTNTVYTTPETTSSENEDEDSNPPNYRSLLSVDIRDSTQSMRLHLQSGNHNGDLSVFVGSSSNQSTGLTSNAGTDLANLSIITREITDNPNDTSRQVTDVTEDRDMTANMITQLILRKENSRQKQLKTPKSSAGVSSNHERTSETDSESDQEDFNSSSSMTSHNSSYRPLSLSRGQRRRRSATSSSYSVARKEFRKQLLRERRREISTTPVYDSTRNVIDNQFVMSTSETNYDRITELMTRNQAVQQQSDSSLNSSSSSSSSDSSSSTESNPCDDQIKSKRKGVISSRKSRSIISSDSSSSDSEETPRNSISVKTNAAVMNETGRNESLNSTSIIHPELKRKRTPSCKLNGAYNAFLKENASPEENLPKTVEEDIPYKRFCVQKSEGDSTSSLEHVAFKKFSKQKDRNYRKTSSFGFSTPPDSGIDVSKEPEPCCSKSFATDNNSAIPSAVVSTNENEQTGEISDKKNNKELNGGLNSIDDPGFEQIDFEEESD